METIDLFGGANAWKLSKPSKIEPMVEVEVETPTEPVVIQRGKSLSRELEIEPKIKTEKVYKGFNRPNIIRF
jgi:hypothetical protein